MINPLFIGPIVEVGKTLIDRLFPDKVAQAAERAKAEIEMQTLLQSGELKSIEVQLSAIIAEANSPDPWTSRARPSFLYVVYILLLSAIPMGIVTAVDPVVAHNITEGYKAWLGSIPTEVLTLFGTVMTGYVLGRSWEKVKGVSK